MSASTRYKRRRIGKEWSGNNTATQVMTKSRTGGADRMGYVPMSGAQIGNPATAIAVAIQKALDPTTAPSKGRSLADMTPEKRAEMLRLYGKKP